MNAPAIARADERADMVGCASPDDGRACGYEADVDEEFARWLKEDFVPLAGAWHY
jgi:hypothetical protein